MPWQGGVWWCVRLETYGFSPEIKLLLLEQCCYGKEELGVIMLGPSGLAECVRSVRAYGPHYARYVTPPTILGGVCGVYVRSTLLGWGVSE